MACQIKSLPRLLRHNYQEDTAGSTVLKEQWLQPPWSESASKHIPTLLSIAFSCDLPCFDSYSGVEVKYFTSFVSPLQYHVFRWFWLSYSFCYIKYQIQFEIILKDCILISICLPMLLPDRDLWEFDSPFFTFTKHPSLMGLLTLLPHLSLLRYNSRLKRWPFSSGSGGGAWLQAFIMSSASSPSYCWCHWYFQSQCAAQVPIISTAQSNTLQLFFFICLFTSVLH